MQLKINPGVWADFHDLQLHGNIAFVPNFHPLTRLDGMEGQPGRAKQKTMSRINFQMTCETAKKGIFMQGVVAAVVRSAVALAMAALICACSEGSEKTGAAKNQQPSTVAVVKVAAEDLSSHLSLTAELKPFQEIELMAKVAGYVKAIYVDIGDRVKKGQLLAVLEVPEMENDLARSRAAVKNSQAEAARAGDELRRAQTALDIAELSFTRLSRVAAMKKGLVAQQEVDDLRSRALSAEAQVAAARSGLEAAGEQVNVNQAALEKTKTMLDYARVIAPFDGVVTKRYADTGSMIQAGTASQTQTMPLVRLSQNSVLRLSVPVPESAVPFIHIAQQVKVFIPTLDREFSGKVARYANKLSFGTRTMDTEIDVQNPGLTLVPGMYADVRLTVDRRERVLTIPLSAVDWAEPALKIPGKRQTEEAAGSWW